MISILDGLVVLGWKDWLWFYLIYLMFDYFGLKIKDFYLNSNKEKLANFNLFLNIHLVNEIFLFILVMIIKKMTLWIFYEKLVEI